MNLKPCESEGLGADIPDRQTDRDQGHNQIIKMADMWIPYPSDQRQRPGTVFLKQWGLLTSNVVKAGSGYIWAKSCGPISLPCLCSN